MWNITEMFLPPRGLDKEKNRVRQIIHTICLTITFLIFIPLSTSIAIGHWNTVYSLLFEEILLWFTLWLNYRGNLKWASRMMVISIFVVATLIILFAGEGTRDISILIYPTAIIIAGLLLSKRAFIIFSAVVILTLAIIMSAEVFGFITPERSMEVYIRDIVDMVIILTITAVILLFLTENLRTSIAQNLALLFALPDLVFHMDREGTFLDFYVPKDQLLYVPPEKFLGQNISALFPGSIATKTMEAIQAALDNKGVQQFEYELPMNNRKEFWEARIAALQANEVVGVVRNITDMKLAEEQRRLSEEKFSQIFITNPDSLALIRLKDLIYIDVNDGFVRLYGYSREDVIGYSTEKVEIWKNAEDRQQMLAFIREKNRIENKEVNFIKKDGTSFSGLLSASIILIAGEACIIYDVRDITEQRKLQTELLQSQKIQSIGTLAGGVAHDFNNILGIIFGYAGLLEKNRLDAQLHKEGLQAVIKAAERGAALVNQILTFARKTEVTFLPLNVPVVIRELLSMLRQTFPKTVLFIEQYAENLPEIMGDKTQIHQALLNLFVNARDAMPHGGSITIDVQLVLLESLQSRFPSAYQPYYICIQIIDTGCGMDDAIRQRIFDPFFTTKVYGQGTGLGLSVVYGIMQAHLGYINVESIPGKGTTFFLYFPATNILGRKQQEEQFFPEEQSRGTETILLVEDEELLMAMVRIRLEAMGYSVLEASDGEIAVEIFVQRHREIDLVLSDLGLPKMNGIDAYIKMKEIDPAVKVIIASGYFDPQIKTELEHLGASGFVMKPYKTDQLLKKIRDVLDMK